MIRCRRILELASEGVSQRTISASTGHARNTVSLVIRRAQERGVEGLDATMTDAWLSAFLFPEKQAVEKGYHPVDWEKVHRELQKKHVTLTLLHQEYAQLARNGQKIPYAYRTFAEKYGQYAKKYKTTMPIRRKPAEIMEVDWAGTTLAITDRVTGEQLPVYVFIATLPYSQYSYAEGFLDMTSPNWLKAHVHACAFFQGVTETVVPDNLKTGVTKPLRGEPVLQEAYREWADHYRTAIVPSRVRKPKDKASVEAAVGFISRQAIAALRAHPFFHLHDLNEHLQEKVEELNSALFQKRPGSRKGVFEEEEKPHLRPLPMTPYKRTDWRTAKVQANYHVQVDRMYYSVPYEYVREQIDVRLTPDLLEFYLNDVRIASHKRLIGDIGQYATLSDHMPDHHRLYVDHHPDLHRQWSETIGPHMTKLVTCILDQHPEKKALTMLSALRQEASKESIVVQEEVAALLEQISTRPTVTVFKTLLDRKRKQRNATPSRRSSTKVNEHGFVRGAAYFGKDRGK
ncbi:IS21 family transposase [Bacillus daqingensis]|uniref:IS21 family transposase n=1 Tax=Bacillus daqingensis TaxID=872396 RepID=A0ABV9NVK2_9BACI